MTTAFRSYTAFLLSLASGACRPGPAPTTDASPQHRFVGAGFTVADPGLAAPVASTSHPNGYPGTRIALIASSQPNSSAWVVIAALRRDGRQTPKQWMDSMWRARVPTDTAFSWLTPARPQRLRVAVGEAWKLKPYCGDCDVDEVFFFAGTQVVVLAFTADEGAFDAAGTARRRFDRMVKSFRWTQ